MDQGFRRRDWDQMASDFGDEFIAANKLAGRQTDLAKLGTTTRTFRVDDSGVEPWLKKRRSKMETVRTVNE
ncbi:hypothetical protein WT27_09150 [Burkholderia territorii]|uniref:Uncharacterized protein n=2 Tax=Burkholderia territorii TaxID=1503055 RepID=A0A119ARU4_9BURK|nr:hypothetical protein WT27_09150 [Burkholderia territorii]